MSGFSYKDIYIEDGKRVLEVNILPEKNCNFDCIFCPIGRSKYKVDTQKSFNEMGTSLIELGLKIEDTKAELVFINSKGEAFVNDKIDDERFKKKLGITDERFEEISKTLLNI